MRVCSSIICVRTVFSYQVIGIWLFNWCAALIKPDYFFALKSPNTIIELCFRKVIAFCIDSKLVTKLGNSLFDRLGDRYRATDTHSLFCIPNLPACFFRKKLTGIFIFILLWCASKGFMKAFKVFIKPFETPRRRVIFNFLSSFGIRTGRVNV